MRVSDSDLGGSPEQVAAILKRKQEVEGQGRAFYSTRKREIENYLCPDMINMQTGIQVAFTDTCDAKKIIGKAVGIKADDVIDKLWPLMTAEQILNRSTYRENNIDRAELKELLGNLLKLVA